MKTKAYAAHDAKSPLRPFEFERRAPGPNDIEIEIAYCGICHSDIHMARNEWGFSTFPLVPGHEIAGVVSRVGAKVKRFKKGDFAGVGCFVDSCRRCAACKKGLEQHCENGASFTYANVEQDKKTPTFGGYSQRIVLSEDYALKIAPKQPLERVAPLLCAGITTYSPLKRFKAGKGKRVGVLGLGGLGHMAIKLASAMGAEVTVLSRSASKKADAQRLGAHEFELTTAGDAASKLANRFDLIIDTVSAEHDLTAPIGWLKLEGTLVLVGAPPKPIPVQAMALLQGRKTIAGSLIGGIPETQEMLDFCAKKKVYADVEVIAIKDVNEAYERTLSSDVRYRFSIDLKTL